ncbi:Uncharacterised protein [Mycobacteroides abscessus subsp. abscessus]|nr:Uncharacterised protein [Mycobacteroides abscessus subsp. abscessus]
MSARKEIQLGRNEYWVATIAVSPLYINSMPRAAAGVTHPVPVVGTMTNTLRSNALVRSSSRTNMSARSSAVSAVSSPAYTRMGSLAGRPFTLASTSACKPPETKLRPSYPRLSQEDSDAGLPDRSGWRGCCTPALVVSLCGPNEALAAAKNPRTNTPLNSMMASTATMAVPMSSDTSWLRRRRRIRNRASNRTRSRSIRATEMNSAPTAMDTRNAFEYSNVVGPWASMRAAIWRCQRAAGTIIASEHTAPRTTTPSLTVIITRSRSGHHF